MSRGFIGQAPNYSCNLFSTGMQNSLLNVAEAIEIKNQQNRLNSYTQPSTFNPSLPVVYTNYYDNKPCGVHEMFNIPPMPSYIIEDAARVKREREESEAKWRKIAFESVQQSNIQYGTTNILGPLLSSNDILRSSLSAHQSSFSNMWSHNNEKFY